MWLVQSHTAIVWKPSSSSLVRPLWPCTRRREKCSIIAGVKDSHKSLAAVELKPETQTITSTLEGSRAPLSGHLVDSRGPGGLYSKVSQDFLPPCKERQEALYHGLRLLD